MKIKIYSFAARTLTTLRTALAISAASLSLIDIASAQALQEPEPNNTDKQIETITVLGAPVSEGADLAGINLKDLPLNAHVVGQTEIERIRFVDPDELLDRIPGETQVRNLRIPDGGKSYTLAFVDGVPIESPYGGATQRLDRVNTFDIQRVEVIKGQTSALFPNNVFGGVVNVVTRDIPEEPQSRVSAELGNFNRQRFGVDISSKVGNLGYALSVNNRRLDGLREGSQNDRDAASLKLVYQLGEQTKLTARVERFEEVIELRGDLSAEQILQDRRQAGGLSSATDLEQNTASLALEHKLNSGEFNAVVLQRNKDTIGLSRFSGPQDENDEALNVKADYRHDFSNGSLTVGFDRYRGDVATDEFGRSDITLSGPFTSFNNQLDIDAYFAQYHANITEKLSVTAGARYEDITQRSDLDGGLEANFDELAPKLGINYQVSDTTQLWASVSDGYYAPDLDDLFDSENGNPNLDQEEAQNIEIGIRGSWGSWAYDSSYYHNRVDNYLVTQELINANGEEFELTTNAGQVTVQGLESVVEYAPQNANWRLGLTHTYADNRFDTFVQSTPGASDDFSGNELARTPKHHTNIRFAWEPVDNFTAELEGDFYSSYFSDDANSEAGKFTRDERINLRLTYQQEHWRVWLNVLNISDTLEDRATFSRGALTFRTVDGRSYYAGVSYQF